MEEAGIEGDISANPLGTYRYAKWGGVCTVTVFAMEVRTVHEKWPESFRDRQWLSAVEAAARATEPALKKMILELDAGDVTPVS